MQGCHVVYTRDEICGVIGWRYADVQPHTILHMCDMRSHTVQCLRTSCIITFTRMRGCVLRSHDSVCLFGCSHNRENFVIYIHTCYHHQPSIGYHHHGHPYIYARSHVAVSHYICCAMAVWMVVRLDS